MANNNLRIESMSSTSNKWKTCYVPTCQVSNPLELSLSVLRGYLYDLNKGLTKGKDYRLIDSEGTIVASIVDGILA